MDEVSNEETLHYGIEQPDISECDDQISTSRQEDSLDRSFIDRKMGRKNDLSRFSEPSSLDYSPSSSTAGSEELDNCIFENDAFEAESGVESVDGDWIQSCSTPPSFEFDLTEEQALETLKYFTLSLSRANQMTKTHQDLDAVLQLLQEKEKDLELAAHIGQSLLERNRNLYKKTEVLESYVNEVEERETQLKHKVTMKDKLLKTFLHDEDLEEDEFSPSESSAYDSCRDESMLSLHEKCNELEAHNANLVLEALKLREETDKVEEKEKQLVYECIKELAGAKEQISHLTDEISLKAEDNIEQQEEISKLISTVLELQERHNQLTEENEELHVTLKNSEESQKDLKVEVSTLHEKYQECFEMLMENQREMKIMKEKLRLQNASGDSDDCARGFLRQDPRDSLAQEIEESVRRDLESSQEKKKHTNRVMQTVRAANTAKRFPKAIKGGSRPAKSGQAKSSEQPFDFSFAASANSSRSERASGSPPSMDELRAAVRRLSVSESATAGHRGRRAWAPEKLQIVKPMEGSATLHKWQSLARPSMSGLHNVVPGVHVKGETMVTSEHVEHKPSGGSDNLGPKSKSQTVRPKKGNATTKPIASGNIDTKNKTKGEGDMLKETASASSGSKTKDEMVDHDRRLVKEPANSTRDDEIKEKSEIKGETHVESVKLKDETPNSLNLKPVSTIARVTSTSTPASSRSAVGASADSLTSTISPNLTEIVKSKLSADQAVTPVNDEPGLLLKTILHSTAAVSSSFVTSVPVTTTAKTSFVPTTTTTTSVAVSTFPRTRHVRSRSSENLLDLVKSFNQPATESTTSATSSASAENLETGSHALNPSPVSQGLGSFVGRLVRSSSSENLAGNKNDELGISRSPSSGKLSDLLKNSDIASTIGKASSFDTVQPNKRASFHLGDSPPSPSQLEMMGDLGAFAFFGPSTSSTPTTKQTMTSTSTDTSTARSMFGALSGLGGFFRPRSKSMDNLGPLPASFGRSTASGSSPSINQDTGRKTLVERSVERFSQAFGPD